MGDSGQASFNATARFGGWVLVIDDHPLFCDALELTLRSVSGISDIASTDTLAAGIDLVSERGVPALVVLDLNLPDVTGMDGLLRIRARTPETPVLVVSSMAENAIVSAAFAAGAAGFVPKHAPQAQFRVALDTIAQGRTYIPEAFVPSAVPDGPSDATARLGTLTAQQARILELICQGKLNKQIAYDLGIAETTVKAHVTAIMRKLGVQSRTQAVLVAQRASFSAILPSEAR